MTIFNLDQKKDEFFTIQFIIFFMIGFFVNVYSNGTATLVYLDNEYSIKPNNQNYIYTPEYQLLQEYSQKISYRNNSINYINLILYFIVSPLLNFIYGFFIFKKKHLNT